MKKGDKVEFICFSEHTTGEITRSNRKEGTFDIKSRGITYPNTKVYNSIEQRKKLKETTPWYILKS